MTLIRKEVLCGVERMVDQNAAGAVEEDHGLSARRTNFLKSSSDPFSSGSHPAVVL
jgi:hypothetical protein